MSWNYIARKEDKRWEYMINEGGREGKSCSDHLGSKEMTGEEDMRTELPWVRRRRDIERSTGDNWKKQRNLEHMTWKNLKMKRDLTRYNLTFQEYTTLIQPCMSWLAHTHTQTHTYDNHTFPCVVIRQHNYTHTNQLDDTDSGHFFARCKYSNERS